ncbi:hypothetical protein [Desulfonatronovibrio hydrogenovorans]|uniref:hypothetical protein n=1 Tax=Desulfonatronovibrio hydrogenovorans TaxID=53245 RepID=UPI0012378591|nr:hypothetical protein [Desulfonatronovibrio hydrogenovorans]
MNRVIFLLVILFILAGNSGCAYMESRFEQRVEPHLDQVIFYQRPVLEKAASGVHVHPVSQAPAQIKAVFFPFYNSPRTGGTHDTGRRIGHIFWRTWLGQEVFSTMIYQDAQEWPGRARAGQTARSLGADLYVMGQVNHYLHGGTQSTTSIAILVNIFSARDDSLIWSMEHAGRMDNRGEMDFILAKRRTWMPESPEYVIVNSLAYELAQPVKMWSHGFMFDQNMPKLSDRY